MTITLILASEILHCLLASFICWPATLMFLEEVTKKEATWKVWTVEFVVVLWTLLAWAALIATVVGNL